MNMTLFGMLTFKQRPWKYYISYVDETLTKLSPNSYSAIVIKSYIYIYPVKDISISKSPKMARNTRFGTYKSKKPEKKI